MEEDRFKCSATSIAKTLPDAHLFLIGGTSGSGKTVLAKAVANHRGALVISLDDYFANEEKARFFLSSTFGRVPQWDHPLSVDIEYAMQNIIELFQKFCTKLPVYSFVENKRIGYRFCKRVGNQPLVLEGIHSLLLRSRIESLSYNTYSVFLDATVDVRRKRINVRDARERNRPLDSFNRRFRLMRIAERHWILPQRKHADLVIDSSNDVFKIVATI